MYTTHQARIFTWHTCCLRQVCITIQVFCNTFDGFNRIRPRFLSVFHSERVGLIEHLLMESSNDEVRAYNIRMKRKRQPMNGSKLKSLFFSMRNRRLHEDMGIPARTVHLFLLRCDFFFPFDFFDLIFLVFFAVAPSSDFPLLLNFLSPFSCVFPLPANFGLNSRFGSSPLADFLCDLSSIFLRFASFALFWAYFICFGT